MKRIYGVNDRLEWTYSVFNNMLTLPIHVIQGGAKGLSVCDFKVFTLAKYSTSFSDEKTTWSSSQTALQHLPPISYDSVDGS